MDSISLLYLQIKFSTSIFLESDSLGIAIAFGN
jgi:hypothetical protein